MPDHVDSKAVGGFLAGFVALSHHSEVHARDNRLNFSDSEASADCLRN